MLPEMFQTKPIRKVLLVGSGGLSIGQAGTLLLNVICEETLIEYQGNSTIPVVKPARH
jgi:hypothetical protein